MSSHTQTCKLHGGILRETQHVALEHQQNTYFFYQNHWFLGPCPNRSGLPPLIEGAYVGNHLLFICLRRAFQPKNWSLRINSLLISRTLLSVSRQRSTPREHNHVDEEFHIESFVLWAGPVPSHHHGLHASACWRRLECFSRVTGYFCVRLVNQDCVRPPSAQRRASVSPSAPLMKGRFHFTNVPLLMERNTDKGCN